MMGATGAIYTIYLLSNNGVRIGIIDRIESIEYALVTNDIGVMKIVITPGVTIPSTALPDGSLEVWRRTLDGVNTLVGETRWLIQRQTVTREGNGLVKVTLFALSPLWLFGEPGRFIDAFATTSGALKTGTFDNLMKAYVRENAGSSASGSRQILGLTVDPDTSQAPSTTKSAAWQPLLKVLKDLADSSAQSGTYLAFDLIATGDVSGLGLIFQTFVGQRGIDRRLTSGNGAVVLGSAYGNLAETSLEVDYSTEVTFCKTGGQGDGPGRLIGSYTNTDRTTATPLRWREVFKDATSYDNTTGLNDEAENVVRANRVRAVISGKVQATQDTQFGRHWNWGDYVTVQEFGYQFDARIDAVSVTYTGGREEINAVVRSEVFLT